jgi:hypothetical protein
LLLEPSKLKSEGKQEKRRLKHKKSKMVDARGASKTKITKPLDPFFLLEDNIMEFKIREAIYLNPRLKCGSGLNATNHGNLVNFVFLDKLSHFEPEIQSRATRSS